MPKLDANLAKFLEKKVKSQNKIKIACKPSCECDLNNAAAVAWRNVGSNVNICFTFVFRFLPSNLN